MVQTKCEVSHGRPAVWLFSACGWTGELSVFMSSARVLQDQYQHCLSLHSSSEMKRFILILLPSHIYTNKHGHIHTKTPTEPPEGHRLIHSLFDRWYLGRQSTGEGCCIQYPGGEAVNHKHTTHTDTHCSMYTLTCMTIGRNTGRKICFDLTLRFMNLPFCSKLKTILFNLKCDWSNIDAYIQLMEHSFMTGSY